MSKLPINAATWFSIPAVDFEKSVKFFEDLLQITLIRDTMMDGEHANPFAMFPKEGDMGMSGAVTPAVKIMPASGGVLVYLFTTDIDGALSRVEGLGGKILSPKWAMPGDMGDIAVIADCEGTPIGLHQP